MKENIISFFQYFFWKRKIKEVHTHSEDSVRRVFRSIAQNGFDYYGESVPYGRAKWFIESEQEFYNEFSNTEFEYFGYSQNYLRVKFKSDEKDLINKLINIKIKCVENDMLIGEKEM